MTIASAPSDLNVHISHEPILQAARVSVKPHLPATTTCPRCSRELLFVYVSPLAGGRWYVCRNCNFSGDSIELYQIIQNFDDIRDSVYELASRGIMDERQDQLTPGKVDDYVTAYVERRHTINAFVKECHDTLGALSQRMLGLLQTYHLWDGYKAGQWRKLLGRFLGGTTTKKLRELGFKVPKGFSNALILPYYDVPGRVSSFLLLGANDRTHRLYTTPDGVEREDGLMMLDTVNLHDEHVIALSNPLMALQIQRKHFNTSSKPLRIVVFDKYTRRAWQSVHARKVIFWDHELGHDLFQQARNHPRAHIASRPRFARKLQRIYVADITVPELISQFRESSASWAETLKHFILEGEQWKVVEAVTGLQLTAQETTRIFDLCTPDERFKVRQVLGETTYERYVYVNNLKIAENEDGWWVVRKDDQRELGCSAIIRIARAIHIQDDEENHYEGEIITKSGRMTFRSPIPEVEKQTGDWLIRQMMQGGLGTPTLQPRLARQLITISKQFHEPQYVQGAGRVGWQKETQAFVFPNFGVKEGAIDDLAQAMVSRSDQTPAVNIHPAGIDEGDWELLLEDRPECAAILAGLTCFMHNMLSQVLGTSATPFGLVGGVGSTASAVSAHLIEELGMVKTSITNAKQPYSGVRAQEKRHNYPCWLDLDVFQRRNVGKLVASEHGNFAANVTEGEAASLSVGNAWSFVYAPGICGARGPLPSLRGFMRFLPWLQGRDFKLEMATSLHASLLLSLEAWLDIELGVDNRAVFTAAAGMLRTADAISLERRLMYLVYWLMANQHLALERVDFYNSFKNGGMPKARSGLLVDSECDKVYISLQALQKAVSGARIPLPDLDLAVQALSMSESQAGFESEDSGFIVQRTFFDYHARRWRKMRT